MKMEEWRERGKREEGEEQVSDLRDRQSALKGRIVALLFLRCHTKQTQSHPVDKTQA